MNEYTRDALTWDVAIVGAGVIGLACAERVTRAGMTAVVLERIGGSLPPSEAAQFRADFWRLRQVVHDA